MWQLWQPLCWQVWVGRLRGCLRTGRRQCAEEPWDCVAGDRWAQANPSWCLGRRHADGDFMKPCGAHNLFCLHYKVFSDVWRQADSSKQYKNTSSAFQSPYSGQQITGPSLIKYPTPPPWSEDAAIRTGTKVDQKEEHGGCTLRFSLQRGKEGRMREAVCGKDSLKAWIPLLVFAFGTHRQL